MESTFWAEMKTNGKLSLQKVFMVDYKDADSIFILHLNWHVYESHGKWNELNADNIQWILYFIDR